MQKNYGESVFNALLIIVILGAIVMSFSYNETARFFPLMFGVIALCMLILQFIVSVMKNPPKLLRFVSQKGATSGMVDDVAKKTKQDSTPVVLWRDVIIVSLWLLGYLVLLNYTGYFMATLIFFPLILLVVGKVNLKTVILYSVILLLSLYTLFTLILGRSVI